MDEQGEQWCECPACQQLQIMDAVIARQLQGMDSRGVQVRPAEHSWPPQRRGSCQSQVRVDALRFYTAPIRGRDPQEGSDGQTQTTAAQAVECYANDHDDDDDV